MSYWLLAAALCWQAAGARESGPPRFEHYPTTDIFHGKPAKLQLITPQEREFRTRLQEGLSAGANFAGHYIVIQWGCGAGCVMMAIVDALTGQIYKAPLPGTKEADFIVPLEGTMPPDKQGFEFRLNSNLMMIRGGCRAEGKYCGDYYFNWTGDKFVLIKQLLKPHN
jgi:hypothetical protein